jgi:dimethylargininase
MIAVTRAVSPTIAQCELTHRPREVIDVARAAAEHACYESALRALGVSIVKAEPLPDHPDAVFVEDTAVVLDEIALLMRPGAKSRRAEVDSMATTLGAYRTLMRIEAPAAMDGGDVLVVGRTLHVGLSTRTNIAAVEQLRSIVREFGYDAVPVEFDGILHLKSAATVVAEGALLINPRIVSPEAFGHHLEIIEVDPAEPDAANALRVGEKVIYAEHFPRTLERLRLAGLNVVTVPAAELAKAEAGVTCCSLVFQA